MKSQMSKNEVAMRTQYDFSKGVRGKYYERFKNGHTVTLLEGEPDKGDSQLTEIAGKHLLISRLVAAGFEVAQPLRDKGIDLVAYRDGEDGKDVSLHVEVAVDECFAQRDLVRLAD